MKRQIHSWRKSINEHIKAIKHYSLGGFLKVISPTMCHVDVEPCSEMIAKACLPRGSAEDEFEFQIPAFETNLFSFLSLHTLPSEQWFSNWGNVPSQVFPLATSGDVFGCQN